MSKDQSSKRPAAQPPQEKIFLATKPHQSRSDEHSRSRLIQFILLAIALITLVLTVILGYLTFNMR